MRESAAWAEEVTMTRWSAGAFASGRRRFLQLVGLAGLASAAQSISQAWSDTRSYSGSPPAPTPARPDSARSSDSGPTPPTEDARALASILQRRYGKHLSTKQLEAVTREIDNRLEGGRKLRDSRLANRDEPDFVFHAG
jgi:hypothetical protein